MINLKNLIKANQDLNLKGLIFSKKLPLYIYNITPYKKDYYLPLTKTKPLFLPLPPKTEPVILSLPPKTEPLVLPLFIKTEPLILSLPKKIKPLVLPSPPKTEPLFLPLPKKISNLSGLFTIDNILREKFKTDPVYFKEFAKFMLIKQAVILYYLFKDRYIPETFMKNICKCFNLVYSLDTLKNNPYLLYFVEHKDISSTQHLLTILGYRFFIDVETFLKSINQEKIFDIDVSRYKKLSMGNLVEFFMMDKTSREFLIKEKLTVNFINHQEHTLGEKIDIFQIEESLQMTSQKRCDFLFTKFLAYSDGTIEINKIYRDVKADFRGSVTGHLTLKPLLNLNSINLNKHINVYTSYIQQQIINNPLIKEIVSEDLQFLLHIRKACKNKNTDELKLLLLQFNAKIFEMSINKIYKDLNLNFDKFTIASAVDIDEDFMKNILPIIVKNAEKNLHLFKFNLLCAKNNQFAMEKVNESFSETIIYIIPEDKKTDVLDNFQAFIEYDFR